MFEISIFLIAGLAILEGFDLIHSASYKVDRNCLKNVVYIGHFNRLITFSPSLTLSSTHKTSMEGLHLNSFS